MMRVRVVIVRAWKSRGSDVFKALSVGVVVVVFIASGLLMHDSRRLISRAWISRRLSILLHASRISNCV